MKKMWILLFVSGLVMSLTGVAQTQVSQEWASRYSGSAYGYHNTGGMAITVDASGNSYVTGYLANSSGNTDIVTIKYDTYGNQKWVQWFDRGRLDQGYDIVTDEQGNVYVTGYSQNERGDMDVVTIKYDGLTGQPLWSAPAFYDGGVMGNNPKDDWGVALAVNSQYVYVAAWSYGEIPGGASTLTDYATIKYDRATGIQNAVTRYDDLNHNYEEPADIALDAAGYVYVTGRSYQGSVNDFDYLTIKYDQNLQNAQPVTLNSSLGQDFAKAIALDGSGNVYVTGGTGLQGLEDNPSRPFDLTTVRYSSSMVEVWRDTYNDPYNNTDHGDDIVVDPAGYVYVTGVITTSSAPGNLDIGTVRYNNTTNGGRLWVKTFGNSVLRDDDGNKLTLDRSGNVYVIGTTQTAASPNTDRNYLTLKYDSNGNLIWNIEYNGIGPGNLHDDLGLDIALDPAENIYVTGPSYGNVNRYDYATVKYNQRIPGGFSSFQTEPSQGRHLVRDPSTGNLHLVMKREDNKIAYAMSTDNGTTWINLQILADGQYPTLGVAQTGPGYVAICVAYVRPDPEVGSRLSYRWLDPLGVWHAPVDISTSSNPGPPSLVISGTWVYVAYQSGAAVLCSKFECTAPAGYSTEVIDNTSSPTQPCLAVDGNGYVYGAWRRSSSSTNQIWYCPRGSASPYWQTSNKLQVDWTTLASKQPFVECYGDSVYVVWSDSMASPDKKFDVRRAAKTFSAIQWQYTNVSLSSKISSQSPTQAWKEFTTWSESIATTGGKFDIYYWRQNGEKGAVVSNPTEWSYWTHSQMRYPDPDQMTHLWTAWTESPNPNASPYRVLTSHRAFWPLGFGPGAGAGLSDYGNYYKVLAGQDTPSVYCKKRDGVLRFTDKAVDFARDSLIYVLPYLDPVYDYYLRVSSYRETGNGWVQALTVNGGASRTVRFAPNLVDTAWVRIPPEAYAQDRKVTFALKNIQGDYVTGLDLTLFQHDPKRGGKGGGPQSGGLVCAPLKDAFAVYPNPVNDKAHIEYSLRASGKVSLSVYDITGRMVRKLVDASQPAGVYKATWDGRDRTGRLSGSGVYFLRLSTSESMKTKRLVVVR